MARRKRTNRLRSALAVVVLGLSVLAVWYGADRFGWRPGSSAPPDASADRVDAANEGHRVRVSGKLAFSGAPRDAQLGIGADGAILVRHVEMYQWYEHCDAGNCHYDEAWSAQRVDSTRFRTPAGHENPPFPFTGARFAAQEIRLGAFVVDADLAAAQLASIEYPVHASALPPNLAATFRDSDGVLYTGDDAEHPQAGALKVSYRIFPAANAVLIGVQRGSRLVSPNEG
jgi:Transmembrane protein 43